MTKRSSYTETTITQDKGPETLRRRPQTMLETSDINAVINSVYEIVSNSTDEAVAGFGEVIRMVVSEDESITIMDNGRGVPMGWNSVDQKYNYELVFCTLYASGKGKTKGDAYGDSEGLNGCGCTVCQFTSDYMDVYSIREVDGQFHSYEMHFKEGWAVGTLKDIIVDSSIPTGTTIKFRPSASVFCGDNAIPKEVHIARLTLKAITNPGLTYTLRYKNDKEMTFYEPGGMRQYLSRKIIDAINEEPIMLDVVKEDCNDVKGSGVAKNYTARAEISIVFSQDTVIQSAFHNGALLSGGPTFNAVLKGVAKALTTQAHAQGLLDATEAIGSADAQNITNFMLQTHCNADFSLYQGQSKTALTNPSICAMVEGYIEAQLTKWLSSNQEVAETIIMRALASMSARELYEATRKKAIKLLTAPIQKTIKRLKGYLDCETNDPKLRELYIIEGESAKGSASLARIAFFQAIQPLRGKIPNSLKRSLNYLLSEDSLILMLLSLFGCGIEIEGDKFADTLPKFDENKINFNKFILAADADVDGGHIIVLLVLMIWVFCPQLLKKGYVYTVKTPLYKLTYKKGDKKHSVYCYLEDEKNKQMKELEKLGIRASAVDIKRYKGLGEMQPAELRDTIMNPEARILQRLIVDDDKAMTELLNILMGTELEERRKLILENFATAQYIAI